MSRTKSNRNAGNSEPGYTGTRKETSSQAQTARDTKRKAKLKGNKAGNRNAVESTQTQKKNARNAEMNKRIGSKKAVPLLPADKKAQLAKENAPKLNLQPMAKVIKSQAPQVAKPKVVKVSPEVEIGRIEDDPRLNDLLEQLDNDEILSDEDNNWVEAQMDRHQVLMKELGWLDEDGEEDLVQQFEDAASSLDQYK